MICICRYLPSLGSIHALLHTDLWWTETGPRPDPKQNRHGSVTIDTDLQNNSMDLSLLTGTIERVQSRSDLLNW